MALSLAIALATSVACVSCTKFTEPDMKLPLPPLKPGTVINGDSAYFKRWPGQPAVFKFTDQLILAIPPQHQDFWRDTDTTPRMPMPIDKIPQVENGGFTMYLPDFTGYTPENFDQQFDEDQIGVAIFPMSLEYMRPGAIGYYPPNSFQRLSTGPHRRFDPERYTETHGLRCYDFVRNPTTWSSQYCYGVRNEATAEYVLLDVNPIPDEPGLLFPQMRTKYYSPEFGGVQINWQAHMKHFARWKEIDQQVWKNLRAWNLVNPSSTPNPIPP